MALTRWCDGSFEDQRVERLRFWQGRTVEERLAATFELSQIAYGGNDVLLTEEDHENLRNDFFVRAKSALDCCAH